MKGIWVLAVVCAFVAGSLVTGAAVFADPDDDDELSSLLCPIGQAMTGILFEDDDEILDVICEVDKGSNLGIERISTDLSFGVVGGAGTDLGCPAGKFVIGGGVSGLKPTTHLDDSFAISDNVWRFAVSFTASDSIGLHIICIDNTP